VLIGETTERSPVPAARTCCATTFPAEEKAVPTARRYVEQTLVAWGLAELAENAKIIISELVTNAVVHGEGPVVVQCAIKEDDEFKDVDTLDVNGRGMRVVEILADGCGAHQVDGGKVSWATLNIHS
jgi:anti-sigma regulatory factor (Ser/Thr protein kinase)